MPVGTSGTEEAASCRGIGFNILGSLDIRDSDAPVPLNGLLRRRILTMLLLEAGKVVPVSRLVDAGWDEAPPETAAHQIRKAMAELRRRIPGGSDLIVTDGPGYRAVVEEDQLDLLRYQGLVRRAHAALDAGDHGTAAPALREALGLWRGPVLAGEGGPVIDAVSTALEEHRLAATEQLYKLLVTSEDAASVIGELRSLVEQHPLRETLRGRLMTALYRSGQQAAALEEFGRIRELLGEELGIDPSAELSELHERILRQDPALSPQEAPASRSAQRPPAARPSGPAAPAPAPAPAGVPHALPYDVPDFSGRASELAWIRKAAGGARADTPAIVAIDGMGGGGKTALALRAAHQLAAEYPDGRLFVDLRGFTPGQAPLSPFNAQGDLLAAAGIPSAEIPSVAAGRNALWQSYMRGRHMLLVLDNAASSAQVRALVPASPGSLVLVTSRPRLIGLDGASWLSLAALPEHDGHEILRQTLGPERLGQEREATAELLRLCGGLPLAVRIAAARLSNRPRWTVQHLVERLRDHGRRLDELSNEGRGVASALLLSYQSMSEDQRTAFRLLSHHPGRYIDVPEAAALLDTGPWDAEDALEELVDARLLESGEPNVYAFHDLVRSFVRRVAQDSATEEAASAVRRLLDHYLSMAGGACDTLFPGRPQYGAEAGQSAFDSQNAALTWLDRHRDSLLAAVDLAQEYELSWHAANLPRELGFHSSIRSYDASANLALRTGVAASRQLGDPGLIRLNLTNLAMGQWRLGRLQEAIAGLSEAWEISRAMEDPRSEAECKARLGQAYNSLGELERALQLSREANRMARETGFTRLDGSSQSTLGHVLVRLGEYEQAVESAERALAVFRSIGETQLSVDALSYLSEALERLGRHEEALARLDEAAELCESLRVPSVLPLVLARRADVLVRLGRAKEAVEYAVRALAEADYSTDDIHRASVYFSAGRAHHACGEHATALRQLSAAYDLACRMELRYEQARTLDGLAGLHLAMGDEPAAEHHRNAADSLFAVMGVPEAAR